jgi:hypothetical protein
MFFVPMASGTSQSIFQVKVPPDLQGRVFAMRSMISRSIMPIAFLIAGPLADVIFEPLMSTDGALSESFIASIIGTGPGRGIGLIFLIGMIGQLAATLAAFLNPRIRNIESDIPDVEVQIESEGDDPALVEGSPLPATD